MSHIVHNVSLTSSSSSSSSQAEEPYSSPSVPQPRRELASQSSFPFSAINLPSSSEQSALSSASFSFRRNKVPIGFRLVGTRTRGTGVSTYTVYMIHVRWGAKRWFIYRRFSDFDRLAALLRSEFPRSKDLPHLPKKHPFRSGTSKTIVEERKPLLQAYLNDLVALEYVRASPHLMRWIAKDGNSSTVGLADPDLEGWLFKRGHLVKNWKVRWVVLKDKTLYYFRDHKNMSAPLGCVPLDKCTLENVSQKRQLTFRIVPADPKFPDFWATAQSETEFAEWMAAIDFARTSVLALPLPQPFPSSSIPIPANRLSATPHPSLSPSEAASYLPASEVPAAHSLFSPAPSPHATASPPREVLPPATPQQPPSSPNPVPLLDPLAHPPPPPLSLTSSLSRDAYTPRVILSPPNAQAEEDITPGHRPLSGLGTSPLRVDASSETMSVLTDDQSSISIPESTDALPVLKARLDQDLLQHISDLNFNLVCLDYGNNPVSPKIDNLRSPMPEWVDDGELRQEGILITKQLKRFCREIIKMTIDDLFVSEPGKFAQNTRFWEIIDELQAYSISHPQWKRFASDLLLHLLPLTRIIPHYHPFASDRAGHPSHGGDESEASTSSVDDPDVAEKPMIRAVLMCFLAFLGGAVGSEFSHALHRGRITNTIAGENAASLTLSNPASPLSPRVTHSPSPSSSAAGHRRQLSDSLRRSRDVVESYPSCPVCELRVVGPMMPDHFAACSILHSMDPALSFPAAVAFINAEIEKRAVELSKAQARQGGIARKLPKSDPLMKLQQLSTGLLEDLKESNMKQKLEQAAHRLSDLSQQKHLPEPDITFQVFLRKLSELIKAERLKLPNPERSTKRQRSGVEAVSPQSNSTQQRQKRALWGLNSIFSSSTSSPSIASPESHSPNSPPSSPMSASPARPTSTDEEQALILVPTPTTVSSLLSPGGQEATPSSANQSTSANKTSMASMGETRPLVGRVSFDSFENIKIISKGAFGTVWLSKKKDTGDLYAIKQLKKSTISRKNMVEHVLKEREILVRTNNPYVVKLFYAFQTPKYCFLVMEYLIGGDCGSLLENLGYFDDEMAKIYIAETVLALEYLHEHGIVHRDLKPDNMLITAKGHIKLTDFGLSSIRDLEETGINISASPKVSRPVPHNAEEDQLAAAILKQNAPGAATEPYRVVGTPDYLSPEALLGIGYGTSVDWWALGVILFEFLTGIPPFNDEAPDLIFKNIIEHDIPWPNIPGEMSHEAAALITRLLTVDRNERLGKNGANEVKQDNYFKGLEWDSLLSRTNMFVPAPRSPTDTGYFSVRDYESGGGVTGVDLLNPNRHPDGLGSDDQVVDLEVQNKFSRFSFASLPEAIAKMNEESNPH